MALGAAESGKVIAQSAGKLVRIWRLARASARREPFPGLLDGLVDDFVSRAGRLLAQGAAPERAWRETCGSVRLATRFGARELTQEWAMVMEVLRAACESFDAAPEVGGWLARAVAEAEKGTAALAAGGEHPPGVLPVLAFGGLLPPRRPVGDDGGD